VKAITELRKTGWYLTEDDGSFHLDDEGHIYFSKPIAMSIGRELGMIPVPSHAGGLKQVVTGYETGA
jgi:hypothetical protein